MRLSKATQNEVCRQHKIDPCDYKEFHKLNNCGLIDNHEFGRRLFTRRNYKQADKAFDKMLSTFHRRTQCCTTS